MQQAVTRNIAVSVETRFLENESDPAENYFVWAYRITIENKGDETVQLLTRHWQITDAMGRLHEVRGEGVIGEQPVLVPGAAYTYSSGTPLGTPSGFMRGSYGMQTQDGARFDIEVPAFSLDSPHEHGNIN
ncbi:MAG: Co2+/Mg2+ efflux protein ApaG [PS1 clade bacterium]|uniref:Protein ApaG n=1 Tax=PS1 clade bacterium TaxID=2175152 RepID=A0A937HJY2_9PROT|nr:Co2+/Mg2+ efflux protein ApaG [PS1 clade bacterium]